MKLQIVAHFQQQVDGPLHPGWLFFSCEVRGFCFPFPGLFCLLYFNLAHFPSVILSYTEAVEEAPCACFMFNDEWPLKYVVMLANVCPYENEIRKETVTQPYKICSKSCSDAPLPLTSKMWMGASSRQLTTTVFSMPTCRISVAVF